MVEVSQWQAQTKAQLPMLYKLAAGMLRSVPDAQDAVQTSLMKAWEKREQVKPEAFRVYLTRILINECHNIQRHRRRVTPVEEMPTEAAAPSSQLPEIMEAIGALPEKLRLPVYLKYLEDLSEEEGARALGIPVTTFRSRLHRARLALQKTLDREVTLG